MPFLSQLIGHPADRIAVIDIHGEHSYQSLLDRARALAGAIRQQNESYSVVAFLTERDVSFVYSLLAIWLEQSTALPLDPLMALPEWEWRVREVGAECLIYSPDKKSEAELLAQRTGMTLISSETVFEGALPRLPSINPSLNALVLYTSGMNRMPRGVIHTFSSLQAQIKSICCAWEWDSHDRMLNVLPLSHIHGLVSGLLCTMAAGGCCELLPCFKTDKVWEHLASGKNTLITAVPAIYKYLIEAWQKEERECQEKWASGAELLRLSIVGSESLTQDICNQWQQISGRPLLIRYGLTEAGIVLSQVKGTESALTSGKPLGGVSVRLVNEQGEEVKDFGELEIRSPQLFKGYFGKEDLTLNAFRHGWFRTGDIAEMVNGEYRILGKTNINQLKSGGYRVSALEIESALIEHPEVYECAVLSTPSDTQEESVCACIVTTSSNLNLEELRGWLESQVDTYKLPSRLKIVKRLPKTKKGKVDKHQLRERMLGA